MGGARDIKQTIEIADLRAICSAPNLPAIVALPSPDGQYERFTAEELEEALDLLVSVWKQVMLERPRGMADQAIERLLFALCTHYDSAMDRFLTERGLKSSNPHAGVDANFLASLTLRLPPESAADRASLFTFSYFMCLWIGFQVVARRPTGRSATVLRLEQIAHESAAVMGQELRYELEGDSDPRPVLLQRAFHLLGFPYHHAATGSTDPSEPSTYLALNVHELALLASRDAFAVGNYGENIEREFERQLSLLFQSLGFFVSTSSSAPEAIDLICQPAGPHPAKALLVDAKISAQPYDFPAADQSALIEHYRHLRSSLKSLPGSMDILMVGPPAAESLPERLKKFQARFNVRISYCAAALLEDLREALIGSIDPEDFLRMLRSSKGVIEQRDVEQLISRERDKSEAVSRLVKTFLGGSKRRP